MTSVCMCCDNVKTQSLSMNNMYEINVPKYMSCHKAIVVITGSAHCFHDSIYMTLILFVGHLWALRHIDTHTYIYISNCIIGYISIYNYILIHSKCKFKVDLYWIIGNGINHCHTCLKILDIWSNIYLSLIYFFANSFFHNI